MLAMFPFLPSTLMLNYLCSLLQSLIQLNTNNFYLTCSYKQIYISSTHSFPNMKFSKYVLRESQNILEKSCMNLLYIFS